MDLRVAVRAKVSNSTFATKLAGENPAQTTLDLESILINPLPALPEAEFHTAKTMLDVERLPQYEDSSVQTKNSFLLLCIKIRTLLMISQSSQLQPRLGISITWMIKP